MDTKISNKEKNSNVDNDRTGSCGTGSAFNFIVGAIALIIAIVIGYIVYTRFLQ